MSTQPVRASQPDYVVKDIGLAGGGPQGIPIAETELPGRKAINEGNAARHVAKNIVAAGLATKCEIQVAYAIGVARPVSVLVETFGTGRIPDERIAALVQKHFDLRPKGIIQALDLLRPIYFKTAAYGHFGRDEPEFSWEATDKVEALKSDAPR